MKPKLFGSIDEFRQAALKFATGEIEALGDAAHVRASFDTEVKAGEGDSRSITFTISTASADRMGDTVALAGWKLENYRKNPVVLWAHDSSSAPVAKATKLWIEADKLKAETEFVPADNPAVGRFSEGVLQLYRGGFLSATSVGFMPLQYAFTEDPARRYGIDFLEQELLEFSCVPVPANPEALIEGKAAGIDIAPVLDWAEALFKVGGDNERILRLADGLLTKQGEQDPALMSFAERILGRSGLAIIPRERIERIERAARAQRLAEKRNRDLDVIRVRAK